MDGHAGPRRPLAMVGRWLPVLIWAGLIYAISAQPQLPQAPQDLLDILLKKGAHVTEYAILAVLLHRALEGNGRAASRTTALAWGLAVAYAISDEVHQAQVPRRTANALDVAIDATGALLGLAVQRWLMHRAAASQSDSRAPMPARATRR